MTETAPARDTSVVRRLARRRAIAGFFVAVLVGVFGVITLPLTRDSGIAVFRIVAIAIAVVVVILSGLALTIARNYPDVSKATGINALLGFVILAIAVGGVLAVLLITRPPSMTFIYSLYTVLLCAMTAIPWNANRQDLRARS